MRKAELQRQVWRAEDRAFDLEMQVKQQAKLLRNVRSSEALLRDRLDIRTDRVTELEMQVAYLRDVLEGVVQSTALTSAEARDGLEVTAP